MSRSKTGADQKKAQTEPGSISSSTPSSGTLQWAKDQIIMLSDNVYSGAGFYEDPNDSDSDSPPMLFDFGNPIFPSPKASRKATGKSVDSGGNRPKRTSPQDLHECKRLESVNTSTDEKLIKMYENPSLQEMVVDTIASPDIGREAVNALVQTSQPHSSAPPPPPSADLDSYPAITQTADVEKQDDRVPAQRKQSLSASSSSSSSSSSSQPVAAPTFFMGNLTDAIYLQFTENYQTASDHPDRSSMAVRVNPAPAYPVIIGTSERTLAPSVPLPFSPVKESVAKESNETPCVYLNRGIKEGRAQSFENPASGASNSLAIHAVVPYQESVAPLCDAPIPEYLHQVQDMPHRAQKTFTRVSRNALRSPTAKNK